MTRLDLTAFVAAVLIACSAPVQGDNGLPIDPDVVSTADTNRGCPADAIVPPLGGMVRIDLGDPERVWLVDSSGRRLSVRWPRGFGLQLNGAPAVVDQRGRRVASDGSFITFPQMSFGDASGTADDPYVVYGMVGSDCYAPAALRH